MWAYTKLAMSNLNKNSSICYRNLKNAIEIWFKLCQKYNIHLCLYFHLCNSKSVSITRTYARRIIKIKNFDKFLYSPSVILDNGNYVDNSIAMQYLQYFVR